MRSERDTYLHLWELPATGAGMASARVTTPLLPAGTNCRAQDSNPHTHFSVGDDFDDVSFSFLT